MMMLVQQSLQEVEFCDQKFLLSITSVTKVLKRVLYASFGATVHLTRHFCTDCATVRYTAFLSLSFIKMNHGINYKIIHLRIKKIIQRIVSFDTKFITSAQITRSFQSLTIPHFKVRNKSAEHIQVHESLIKFNANFNTLVKYLYFLNDNIPKR